MAADFATTRVVTSAALPPAWRGDVVREHGDAGLAWVGSVPGTIAELRERWRLSLDGPPWHGWLGLVLPVQRDGEALALKLAWPDPGVAPEATALAAWDGNGAVRLHEVDLGRSALMLERLDQRCLEDIPIGEAVDAAGSLIRRLAIPAPPGVPRLSLVAAELAESLPARWEAVGRPLPERAVQRAVGIARELGPDAGDRLVDYDLHYGNVLTGEREP
jgi:streptomycin 6-kinase